MQISHSNMVNGGVIKFSNRSCNCGKRVGIGLSETQRNPNKLYLYCKQTRNCGYF